jgi:hypothetical protein
MGKHKKIYLVPDGVTLIGGEKRFKVSRTENMVHPIFGDTMLESEALNWIRDPDITVVISGNSRLMKERPARAYRPLLAHGEE